MTLILGRRTGPITGNITTLEWIKPGFETETEGALGFAAGRLGAGYWILLLKSLPAPEAFEFDGTTLRSGGREGLPASDWTADAARTRVHDRIVAERGKEGYRALQKAVLASVSVSGDRRLCKLVPMTRHSDEIMPDTQYPMGGGGLQWAIKPPGLSFLAAVRVDSAGVAHTPGGTHRVRDSYDDRARLRRYMMTA